MRNITVAITVDNKMGIAFNKRRQSRDKALIDDLCAMTDKDIYISSYSALLFEAHGDRIKIVDDPLAECPDGGFCFVEMTDPSPHLDSISDLVVYYWNRLYPSDKKLSIDIEGAGFTLATSSEFVGNSHDKITKIVYQKHN